jgi:hypothetical protein
MTTQLLDMVVSAVPQGSSISSVVNMANELSRKVHVQQEMDSLSIISQHSSSNGRHIGTQQQPTLQHLWGQRQASIYPQEIIPWVNVPRSPRLGAFLMVPSWFRP